MITIESDNLLNKLEVKNQHQYHKPLKLHLWFPDLFNFTGGIKCYSSFCLKALQNLYPNFAYDIFIKHETNVPPASPNLHFHMAGHWPLYLRTYAFATQLFDSGIRQHPHLIFSGHLNFTPAAYRLKQLTGIPYWTVAHGIDAWNIRNSNLQTALKYADRIITGSHYTRNRLLQEQNLDPDKVLTLLNTFDANRFQIAPKPNGLLKQYGLNSQQPIILTVARLAKSEQYKGYDKILTALPQIRQAIPNVHYILVGAGDDRPRVEQLISKYQLQDCITLTGYIPDAEIGKHYNLCDIFAMPSKGEGFGIVYLEALACGKPTLGGNKDGAVDALCQGELGALIDPDDTQMLAQTVVQILQGTYPNPLIYQPEVLRKKVIERFGFEQFQNTLGSYLENHLINTFNNVPRVDTDFNGVNATQTGDLVKNFSQ